MHPGQINTPGCIILFFKQDIFLKNRILHMKTAIRESETTILFRWYNKKYTYERKTRNQNYVTDSNM